MIFNVTKNLKKYLQTTQKSYTDWITKIDQKYRLDKIFQIRLLCKGINNIGYKSKAVKIPTDKGRLNGFELTITN